MDFKATFPCILPKILLLSQLGVKLQTMEEMLTRGREQIGNQEEFRNGKGGQELLGAAQGGAGGVQGRPERGTQSSGLVTSWGWVTDWI